MVLNTARMQRIPRIVGVLLLGLLATTWVACTPTVPMERAAHAILPVCAEVSVRLPKTIGDLERVNTNAQGTAAWGNPTAVLFRCGLDMPVASNELCTKVGDVDWLADGSHDPDYVFISYGRNPAVEVIVDNTLISGRTVLEALNDAVRVLDQEHFCIDFTDLEDPPEL